MHGDKAIEHQLGWGGGNVREGYRITGNFRMVQNIMDFEDGKFLHSALHALATMYM